MKCEKDPNSLRYPSGLSSLPPCSELHSVPQAHRVCLSGSGLAGRVDGALGECSSSVGVVGGPVRPQAPFRSALLRLQGRTCPQHTALSPVAHNDPQRPRLEPVTSQNGRPSGTGLQEMNRHPYQWHLEWPITFQRCRPGLPIGPWVQRCAGVSAAWSVSAGVRAEGELINSG